MPQQDRIVEQRRRRALFHASSENHTFASAFQASGAKQKDCKRLFMTEKDFFKQMDGKRLFMTDLYLTYSTAYLESFHPLLRDQQYQPCQVALQNFRALAFFYCHCIYCNCHCIYILIAVVYTILIYYIPLNNYPISPNKQ